MKCKSFSKVNNELSRLKCGKTITDKAKQYFEPPDYFLQTMYVFFKFQQRFT